MSPRRRLLIAATALLALVVAVVVVVRIWQGSGAGGSGYPDQARPGAVLLVPGYGGNTGSLADLANAIRATGRTAIVVSLPDGGTGDLTRQAATLQKAVEKTKADSLDLVGYSAGGVVVRLWVDRYAGAHVARRVVTLGAPLHGTTLAGEGAAIAPDACPLACQQLTPGSSLLTTLNDAPLPGHLRWLSIWTDNDQTVMPPTSAKLTGAVNLALQSICPDAQVAHGQLPSDRRVTGLVLAALGSDPLATPTRCPSS
jgi:triacylglycerol lipase